MALSVSSVFEVRIGGSDTNNGGGFVTGASGTDYSQQNSPQYSLTGCTSAGAGNVILTSSASVDMIGNIARAISGTNVTVAWYQITAVSAGVSITFSTNPAGTSIATGVVASGAINIGGALFSPGIAASLMSLGGMKCFVKNEGTAFSITSASTNISSGTLASAVTVTYIGYQTNRNFGNTDSPPTIITNVSTATQVNAASQTFFNFIFDGNSQTASKHSGNGTFIQCLIQNFNTASTAGIYINCGATGNSAAVFLTTCVSCDAWANSATPFNVTSAINCTSVSNTGASNGFIMNGNSPTAFVNCVAVSNAGAGFQATGSGASVFINCIAESNTGVGFTVSANTKSLINCATFNNSSRSSGTFNDQNPLTPSASVFVSAPTNLALNNTAGAGASLKAASYPSLFPRGTSQTYLDIGAFQSQAGSSGMLFIPNLEGV